MFFKKLKELFRLIYATLVDQSLRLILLMHQRREVFVTVRTEVAYLNSVFEHCTFCTRPTWCCVTENVNLFPPQTWFLLTSVQTKVVREM